MKSRSRKHNVFTGHVVYEEYSIALPKSAKLVAQHLATMRETFRSLFSDENFLTLLRAEGVTTIPAYLKPLFEEARSGHEIY